MIFLTFKEMNTESIATTDIYGPNMTVKNWITTKNTSEHLEIGYAKHSFKNYFDQFKELTDNLNHNTHI